MATSMLAACGASAAAVARPQQKAVAVAAAPVSAATRFAGPAPCAATKLSAQRAFPRASSVVTRAAAPEATESASTTGRQTWYALVANAEFMLNDVQNESLAEQLREKVRFYKEQEKELDFFLVCEPEWLDDLPQAKQVGRPAVAIVSPDKVWITFMKLRLDRVLKVEIGELTVEEATKCGATVPEFTPPAKWTAPYSPYTKGWWEVFMPGMKK